MSRGSRKRRALRLRERRRTMVIAGLAAATTGSVGAIELMRVWRKGSGPNARDTEALLEAGRKATMQTLEVAVSGFRATPPRETALLNLLGAFVATLGVVRASTWSIRERGRFGPFRDLHIEGRHIHHFIPGILIAFVSGGWAICTRDPDIEKWIAIPFGAGVALTLDEAALLLELEDVYWSDEGVVSVEIALGAAALLASIALGSRMLRRGEERVLPGPPAAPGP